MGSGELRNGPPAWACRHRDVPFFLFVHTHQPHFPYHSGAGRHPRPPGRLAYEFTSEDCERVYGSELRLTPEERRYVTAHPVARMPRSAASCRSGFAEGMSGRAHPRRPLRSRGRTCGTTWTSAAPATGTLAVRGSLLHVPLAWGAPGRVAAATRLAAPVSLLHVAPATLDLCGLPRARAHAGRSLAAEPSRAPKCAPSSRSPSSTAPTASRCARDRSR